MKSFMVFAGTMLYCLTITPLFYVACSLVVMKNYLKHPDLRNANEKFMTLPNKELHQDAVKGDYINFVLHVVGASLPAAIGGGFSLGSLNVHSYKKKKELEDSKYKK